MKKFALMMLVVMGYGKAFCMDAHQRIVTEEEIRAAFQDPRNQFAEDDSLDVQREKLIRVFGPGGGVYIMFSFFAAARYADTGSEDMGKKCEELDRYLKKYPDDVRARVLFKGDKLDVSGMCNGLMTEEKDYCQVVKILLQNGFDPNDVSYLTLITSLRCQETNVLYMFLEYGMNPLLTQDQYDPFDHSRDLRQLNLFEGLYLSREPFDEAAIVRARDGYLQKRKKSRIKRYAEKVLWPLFSRYKENPKGFPILPYDACEHISAKVHASSAVEEEWAAYKAANGLDSAGQITAAAVARD